MGKRGQIAVFLILGVAIIILASFVGYTQTSLARQSVGSSVKQTNRVAGELVPVQKYAEGCLEDVSNRGLWLIGEHGGYIAPEGNDTYGDDGVYNKDPSLYTSYGGENVPYYLIGTDDSHVIALDDIEIKLSRYVIVEFEKCLGLTAFRSDGLYITGPKINYADINFDFGSIEVGSNVSINLDSVTVSIEYPLNVSKRDFRAKLKDFRVELPVRLGRLYNASFNEDNPEGLLKNITNEWNDGDTDDYNLEDFNCDLHDGTDKQINIYSRNSDNGAANTKIIKLIDYKPFYNKYARAYVFQFAVKGDDPIKFTGEVCSGD